VAVDAQGRESGVSDMAELPHPLVAAADLPQGRAGAPYRAAVAVSASDGHLVSADENGKAYQMKFRAGDELSFELAGAPEGLAINPQTGVIEGNLPAGARGRYELKIGVTDRRTGSRDAAAVVLTVI
jgi:hypothetical protein